MHKLPDNLLYQLHQSIGLNPASINTQALCNAVNQRMHQLKLDDMAAYVRQLHQNEEELQLLIEAVVVPETSFFRHPAAFMALRRLIAETPEKDFWRILCLPCSTGEEPYSVAMCLLQAGLKPQQFSIDAVDISRAALAQAERGVYPAYSFRSEMAHQYMHFFKKTAQGYHLSTEVRQCVRFHHGNILDRKSLLKLGQYPVVFCRNLLIYLHAEARTKAAKNISRLLEADGTLFAGNAENAQVWQGMFRSRRIPLAFALCHPARQKDTQTMSARQIRQQMAQQQPQQQPGKQQEQTDAPVVRATNTVTSSSSLDHIRLAANQGQLDRVHQLCQQRMRSFPRCAKSYFYEALAYEAEGQRMAAIRSFRQAIYLQPDYTKALQHLALLLEVEGQRQAAERVRQRLQHLKDEQHAS